MQKADNNKLHKQGKNWLGTYKQFEQLAKKTWLDPLGGGPPKQKGWITQMEEHWYIDPEVSVSSTCQVKVFFATFFLWSNLIPKCG